MMARKAPNCTSRPTAIASRRVSYLTACWSACRVFDPQASLVPPSTATTPASVCVTCSREDISSDIAIFGVSSCLDMASLERDMRTGWGMKAHAEATRHASTRNSASGTRVWQSVSRRGGAELMVCESSVCVRCEQEACASQGSRGAEISVEAHSTFFVEGEGVEEECGDGFQRVRNFTKGQKRDTCSVISYTPTQAPLPLDARDRGVAALPSSRQ